MSEETGVDGVIGRWELGRAQVAGQRSSLHPARLIGGGDADRRLVEIHHLPDGIDPSPIIVSLRQASRISDPGLVTIVDVGSGQLGGRPVIYVATTPWSGPLGPGPRSEDDLRSMARSLAGGLAALHRSDLTHGAIYRDGVRWSGSAWQLGPAGLSALVEAEIAPYRPPGLHVVEQAGPAADLWSLGVILHEQATGRLLRPGERVRLPGMAGLEPLVIDLLRADPNARPSAESITAHLGSDRGYPSRRVDDATGALGGTAGPATGSVPPLNAPPPSHQATPIESERATPSPSRSPRPVLLSIAALAVVVAGIALTASLLLGNDPDSTTAADATEAGGADPTTANDDTTAATSTDAEESDQSATPTVGDATTAPDDGIVATRVPVALDDLVIGDCVDVDLTLGDPRSAERVDCAVDHLAEVIEVIDHRSAADDRYPGRATLLEEAQSTCEASFEDVVGAPSLTTSLFVLAAVPTFREWDGNQRRATVCLAHRFDNTPLVGGLAGRLNSFELIQGSTAPVSKLFGSRCFEIDSSIDTIGRRQTVNLIGCENLHRHETLSVENLPLDDEARSSDALTSSIATSLAVEAPAVCQGVWDELTPPPGLDEPTISSIVPDVMDWQLGDRLMTCVASWDEPILGSVVMRSLPPPGAGGDG